MALRSALTRTAQLGARGARRLSAAPVTEIKKVGMVGLGLMGHGIAQAAATAGYDVVGVEMSDGALAAGKARIDATATIDFDVGGAQFRDKIYNI